MRKSLKKVWTRHRKTWKHFKKRFWKRSKSGKGLGLHKIFMVIGFSFIIISIFGYLSYTGELTFSEAITTDANTTSTIETGTESLAPETTTVKTTIEKTTTTKKAATSTIPEGDPDCEVFFECPEGTNFVASKYSTKYHRCNCQSAYKIKLANIVCFYTKEHAEEEGYSPHSCI